MTLHLRTRALTDQGKVRARNEDSHGVRPDLAVAVVADGMGGHPSGAEASALAVRSFLEHLVEARNGSSSEAWGEWMAKAVVHAHRTLLSEARGDPARHGMGTTLTALRVDPDSGEVALAHVGDSRAYRLRDGTLEQLSHDHTWVQEQVDRGVLDADLARVHPMAHVLTRVVGGAATDLEPDLRLDRARPGDVYLLCTDGLTTHLGDEAIQALLSAAPADPEGAARALVAEAMDRGGSDNVTVAVLRVADEGDEAEER